ncbi:MAG: MFS transporter [Nakamurella sp.]
MSLPGAADTPANLLPNPLPVKGIAAIVGFLVCVELASGVLQGYYTPIFTDIARHLGIRDADVNWFEAAQLVVSALVVPLLARLGDLTGHRKILLLSTVVTALASWAVAFAPSFPTFLIGWALQGFYVVWLPLEVAIIHRRTSGDERRTRSAAGVLVGALELGVIVAALASGALVDSLSMTTVLALPAIVVTLALPAIWFGVKEPTVLAKGRIDWPGFGLLTLAIALLMAGLVIMRLTGPANIWPWLAILAGILTLYPFGRLELLAADRGAAPLIDLRILSSRGQWPIQLTALLFGASVLGAQIPLSTFVRTDPAVTGYGLGADASTLSLLIGGYVLSLAAGALSYPLLAKRIGTHTAMMAGGAAVAVGYLLFLPLHTSMLQVTVNMVIAGLGSGALVAALPAAAAAQAPSTHTGFVTGMTNTTKTIGGAIASSVFAIALSATGSIADPAATGTARSAHPAIGGYLTVWAICGLTALLAAAALARRQRPASARTG